MYEQWRKANNVHARDLAVYSAHIGGMFSYVPLDILKEQIDSLAAHGRRFVDISGGEPLCHPRLPRVVSYCIQRGLTPRIITNAAGLGAQADSLHAAGLREVEISVHGYAQGYAQSVGAGIQAWHRLMKGIESASRLRWTIDFNYSMVKSNYTDMHRAAELFAEYRPRLVSFLYFIQNYSRSHLGYYRKMLVRYSVLRPYLESAIRKLDKTGCAVNVRYVPFCMLPGLEKHICGVRQHIYDPYEWLQKKTSRREARSLCDLIVEQRCVYPRMCERCGNRRICDGLNKYYFMVFGDHELAPVPSLPEGMRSDPMCFRKGYRRAQVR